MDDFEYSFQISELDWDNFFQACEKCNILPPGLAGLDDSGMSDIDDMANQRKQIASQTTSYDLKPRTGARPDCVGSPVEFYLSKYGLSSPDQVLSGSEDDFHLEAVNVFFERLRSVTGSEGQKNLGSKMAGHLERYEVKEDAKAIAAPAEISPSYRNLTANRNYCHKYMIAESTDDDLDIHKMTCPETELFIKEEDWSLDVLKQGDQWEDKTRTQPESEKSLGNVLVNGKQLIDLNQLKEAHPQPVTSNNSDLLVAQGHVSNVTPRRRRRKKKRISIELMESDTGYEAQLPSNVSDSDEGIYRRRREMDRETHTAECCVSGNVSEVCCTSQSFLAYPKKNSILENFSVALKGDIRKSTAAGSNLQKDLSQSAVRFAQSKREMDIMFDANLTGEPAETKQLAMTADLRSLELGVSVTETPQNDTNPLAHSNENNVGTHLQHNSHSSSELLASAASSNVPKIEEKPASVENLVESILHDTDDIKTQTHHITSSIPSHEVVYSKAPESQSEHTVTLSDAQFDGFSAVGQRKTSISCVTFPERTDETLFSVSCKTTDTKENSSSVTHVEVPHVDKNDELRAKESLSEASEADHVNMMEISHQNEPMIAAQILEPGEIKETSIVEPKLEMTNEAEESKETDISNISVNSKSEDWEDDSASSVRLNYVPQRQECIDIKADEILSPVIKGDQNDELSLEGQTEEYRSPIHTTEPDNQLSDHSEVEPKLCNIHTSGEEQKGHILSVNPQPCLIQNHDLSPTLAVQYSPSPPESTGETKSLEMLDSDSVCQPTPPIYAISSFWNEMEKLTINDILRLRLVGHAQHPSVLLQPEDSITADVTDATDSGYFTHSDESKPDHSSGNTSVLSDFDGEFAQLLTSEGSKLDECTCRSPDQSGIIWESDSSLSGTATGMEDVINIDTACSSPLLSNNSTHCFKKMCKNISVQNLQALEGQNVGKIIRNASLHTFNSVYPPHSEVEVEDDYIDPFDQVETSSPVYLSDEEETESTGITFSEILEYLFGTDEPKQSVSEAETGAASQLNEPGASLPEMYDQFFAEFEPESFFSPLANDNSSTNDELVPIFSSSHSANRTVQFPEVYDYFFPDDSPVHSDEDEEPEHMVIRVVTRYDHMPTKNHNSVIGSDPYKDFSSKKDSSWSFLWTNPFSFRRGHQTGFTVPPEDSSSQALTPMKNTSRSFHRGIQAVNVLGIDESPFPDPLIISLENRIFRQMANQQKICNEMQTIIADPRLDASLLPIKQADMCLVCIAFASWVLKSVNPQGADTWKAVALANISALSAIRYLRRFTRDEAAKVSPLRQIKPA